MAKWYKKAAKYMNPVSSHKKHIDYGKKAYGGIRGKDSEVSDSTRSEAAGKQLRDVNRQAGTGQVSYKTEEDV
jgi:hypothetical protein